MARAQADEGRLRTNQEEKGDRQVVRQVQQLEDIEALQKSPGMGSRENRTTQRQQDAEGKAPEKRLNGSASRPTLIRRSPV